MPVSPRATERSARPPQLTERQSSVLRAVVASYVGDAHPIGSATISHLLPVHLSPATVRTLLAELAELGLVDKPHSSAGRVPTQQGLRRFVDELLAPADLAASERREIAYQLDGADWDRALHLASALLSRHTRQLGFVVAPRIDRVVLRHVSLVRLSSERLMVVLVARSGASHRCTVADEWGMSQRDLDRIATLLNERVAGCTLPQLRGRVAQEARAMRREADELRRRAFDLWGRALEAATGMAADLVIETHLALLGQPEFSDPRRIRELFEALETKERLLQVIDQVLDEEGVSVAIGEEIEDPALRRCALVVSQYGGVRGAPPLGVLGVIGPSRMDFARVIPLVDYLSEVVTGRLES